jgi:hypothetical protein
VIRPTAAAQKVVLEAGSVIASLSVVTAAAVATAVTAAGIAILRLLQKVVALIILPQIQRIHLGHLHTAEAGKYSSQNL